MKTIKCFYLSDPVIKVFLDSFTTIYKFDKRVYIIYHIRRRGVSIYNYYILDYDYNLKRDIYEHHTVYNMISIDNPLILSSIYGYGGRIIRYNNINCIPIECTGCIEFDANDKLWKYTIKELAHVPYPKFKHYRYSNNLFGA